MAKKEAENLNQKQTATLKSIMHKANVHIAAKTARISNLSNIYMQTNGKMKPIEIMNVHG